MRNTKRDSPGISQVGDHGQAAYWRSHPLAGPGALFIVSEYVEQVYGRVVAADHRLDNAGGILKYAAAFVNREEVQFRPRALVGSVADDKKLAAILPELQEERLSARRVELRRLLRAAVRGPAALDDPDFENQSDKLLEGIVKQTEGRIEWKLSLDRNVGWRVFGIVNECDGFVAVVTSLLLSKKHRELLGQCRKCQRFFPVEHTEGKPRRLYCTDECMNSVNAADGTARQRDRYKRIRAVALFIERHGRSPNEDAIKQAIKQAFKDHPGATVEQLADYAKALIQTSRKRK